MKILLIQSTVLPHDYRQWRDTGYDIADESIALTETGSISYTCLHNQNKSCLRQAPGKKRKQ